MTDANTQVEATNQPGSEAAEELQQAVNTTEEASVKDGAGEQQEQTSTTPGWVQKRFDQMTRQRHEAERRAQEAEARAATFERLANARNSADPENANAAPPAHAQSQGNDDERIEQRAQQLNEVQQFNARANAVYDSGKAEFPDFDDALQNLKMLEPSVEFFKDVVTLDDPQKILYALGRDPEEAARILSLPPLQQGRALERLANKAVKPAAKKPLSNAPEPIAPVVEGGSSTSVDLSKASIDDFMKARNSQSRRR